MFAIRIKGGEVDFIRTILLSAKIDHLFLPIMADNQFAALKYRWQNHHQRGNHSVHFLTVAMRKEKTSRLVKKQVVQLRFKLLVLKPEFFCNSSYDLEHELLPLCILQMKFVRHH